MSSNPFANKPSRVWSHGKWIEIESIDPPPRSPRKVRQKSFTQLQLEWAADTAKAAGTPGAMVWILLSYLAWKNKSATFPFSNTLLARYGITRYTKYRILANLEKAGWIKIQYHNKQAPIVTLLAMPDVRNSKA